MQGLTPLAIGALVVLTLLAVAGAGVSAFWARQAWPIAQRAMLDDLSERVRAAETIVEGLTGKWTATKADIAGILEEVEDVLEAVERKRRRIAATESKQTARENGAAQPRNRQEELRELARARGIRV